jgi:Pyridoxamine 5'-phosphate oxidase
MNSSDIPQGDMRLLTTDRARALLCGTVPARVAYVARDCTPRVFPTHFLWNGEDLVMGTYAGALKIAGLRARPAVAVTIDTDEDPPTILQLRGLARVTDVKGVVPEYIAAMRRFRGRRADRSGARRDRQARAAHGPHRDHPDMGRSHRLPPAVPPGADQRRLAR